MSNAIHDQNRRPTILAVSDVDASVTVPLKADPTTGRLKVEGTGTTQLISEEHDEIQVTYPTGTTEVYTYKLATVTVATVTVTYSDSTKAAIVSVVKS